MECCKKSASNELNTVEEKNLKIVQLKRSLADDFVTFLNNLEEAPKLKDKVKSL